MTYIYTDRDDDRLEIHSADLAEFSRRGAMVKVGSGLGVTGEVLVAPDAAVEVARELCRAAGRDVVILDRPDSATDDGPGPRGWYRSGWSVGPFEGDRVSVQCLRVLEPDEAREMAAVLAAYADRVESKPDPDEVRKLADVIGRAAVTETPVEAARAVLRAGYKRETP